MTTEDNAGTEVGSFLERARREIADAADSRIAALREEESQLRVTIDLANALKPDLAVEAAQLMLRVQQEITTVEQALARLVAPPRPPERAAAPEAERRQSEPPKEEDAGPEELRSRRAAVKALADDASARVESLLSRDAWSGDLYYDLRRAVASLRDVIASARSARATAAAEAAEGWLEEVYRWYDGLGRPGGFVYGFSRGHHGGGGWRQLCEAYDALQRAEEVVEELSSLTPRQWREPRSRSMAEGAWLAQQVFREVVNRHSMSLAEPRQESVRDALLSAVRDGLTPFLPREESMDIGAALASVGDLLAPEGAAGCARESALSALEEPSLGAPLARLAAEALEAGVPPSDLRLRAALAPRLEELRGAGHPGGHFGRLMEYLESDAAGSASAAPQEDEEAPDLAEADYQRVLSELLPLTRGKTALFLGGSADPEKTRALEEELCLKSLDWPQTTAATKLGFFLERVPRADIVVRLSRFSRKAYKEALAEAKRQGKMCVTLAGGLGLHNVVRQAHEQLVPKR